MFILTTDVRLAEALSLTVADLGSVDGHQVTGKGGGRERVTIAPRAHRILRAYLDQAGITEGSLPPAAPERAYTGRRGRGTLVCRSRRALQLRPAVRALAVQSAPRMHHAGAARRAGLPMVQAAARHASPQTTMCSAHDMHSLDTNTVDDVNWRGHLG